jgi:hypothetical protein
MPIFENRVLRKTFGSQSEAAAGPWSKLHRKNVLISTAYQVLLG